MQKIKFELKNDELNVINQIIENRINQQSLPTPETKLVESIIYELADKMLKKFITERMNSKAFKISLKYHQAYALHFILRDFQQVESESPYINMVVLKIANQIHEQL
ncbi:hypothetical protein HXZ62_05000 [Empedobacter falsenii]|uniref:hypothetical protein n=1 Tax=Empedobacter falsenii TaxID=343874 RepID=UPI0025771C5C|nr:hypothetical protein [Empedobacter falsenii]MDM1061925.1 hypothetical protein [Empedobacter falsenii]